MLQQQQIQKQFAAALNQAQSPEEALRASLYQNPNSKKGLLILGNQALLAHNPKKAEKYFKKALKKDPKDPTLANNLAMLYMSKRKRLNKARRLVERALPNAGENTPTLLNTLAHISTLQGRSAEADIFRNQAKSIEATRPSVTPEADAPPQTEPAN